MTAGFTPPGWPASVWPVDVDGWIDIAVQWLLDTAGVADWREVEVLRRHPQVLARFVAEHLEANLAVARVAWQHLDQLVDGAATPAERDEALAGTRVLLQHEGPRTAAAVVSARLLEQALRGERWVPRL